MRTTELDGRCMGSRNTACNAIHSDSSCDVLTFMLQHPVECLDWWAVISFIDKRDNCNPSSGSARGVRL
ncbi:MAG: hypothetical protein P8J18_10140 [Halieaceae bacterium]|nr:hypothetical protein [Halieaceae bacterium]